MQDPGLAAMKKGCAVDQNRLDAVDFCRMVIDRKNRFYYCRRMDCRVISLEENWAYSKKDTRILAVVEQSCECRVRPPAEHTQLQHNNSTATSLPPSLLTTVPQVPSP